jgi:flagellar protein FlaC
MGKEEVEEEPDEEGSNSDKQASDIVYSNETDEEDAKSTEKPPTDNEKQEDTSSDVENNPDNLRRVIKVDSSEGKNEAESQKPKEQKDTPKEADLESTTRDSLEQKRAILQSIKDFDFQIKKNQEDLSLINKKIDNVTKDLDDLVSLYEIVSEQMNPFVGLSKVTKKRIDALENFTKEIELLKERTGELESFAEQSGVKLKKHNIEDLSDKKENLNSESETEDIESSEELDKSLNEDGQKYETELSDENLNEDISLELSDLDSQQPITLNVGDDNRFSEFSESDWDIILEKAFSDIIPDNKIELIIDEFIESLKG